MIMVMVRKKVVGVVEDVQFQGTAGNYDVITALCAMLQLYILFIRVFFITVLDLIILSMETTIQVNTVQTLLSFQQRHRYILSQC